MCVCVCEDMGMGMGVGVGVGVGWDRYVTKNVKRVEFEDRCVSNDLYICVLLFMMY